MSAPLQKYYAADREVRIHANSEADQEFYFAPDVDERISRLSTLNAEMVKALQAFGDHRHCALSYTNEYGCTCGWESQRALLDEGEKQKI